MSSHILMSSRNINDQHVHRRFSYQLTTLKLSNVFNIHLTQTHNTCIYKL
ncbi:hypothetical protein Hanom_Chr15g01367101 [Helianthus anomalus]